MHYYCVAFFPIAFVVLKISIIFFIGPNEYSLHFFLKNSSKLERFGCMRYNLEQAE